MAWFLVVSGAVAGAGAGAGMRLVLGRLARGARVRAPVCEVAVAVLWAATVLGPVVDLVPAGWVAPLLGLTWLAVAVTLVDLRHHRIPDALTFPALPLALVCVIPFGGAAVCRALAGAAVAVAVHAVVHLASPRSMGAGDVKLAAPLGAVLATAGWSALPLAAVLAALLTATIGTATVLARTVLARTVLARTVVGQGASGAGRGAGAPPARRSAFPHGPSMVLAAVVVTGCFALAGAAPAPDVRAPGPVPAGRAEVQVGVPGWA